MPTHSRPAMRATDPDMEIIMSPRVHATTMLVWALDRVGPKLLTEEEDPETVRMECSLHLGRSLPNLSFDRLMAALHIVTTDSFETSVPDFVELCNVLSGSAFDPTVFDPAEPDECAWGVAEALLLSPDADPDKPFLSPEIEAYIAETLKAYGFTTVPTVLASSAVKEAVQKASDDLSAIVAEDPEQFEATWSERHNKADTVDVSVRHTLQELLRQLEGLHLVNGNSKDLISRLQHEMKSTHRRD